MHCKNSQGRNPSTFCVIFGSNENFKICFRDLLTFKGQLISKSNCQAEDFSKKRTNEFVFTSMRRVFIRFLEESSTKKKPFRNYLTFRSCFFFITRNVK